MYRFAELVVGTGTREESINNQQHPGDSSRYLFSYPSLSPLFILSFSSPTRRIWTLQSNF